MGWNTFLTSQKESFLKSIRIILWITVSLLSSGPIFAVYNDKDERMHLLDPGHVGEGGEFDFLPRLTRKTYSDIQLTQFVKLFTRGFEVFLCEGVDKDLLVLQMREENNKWYLHIGDNKIEMNTCLRVESSILDKRLLLNHYLIEVDTNHSRDIIVDALLCLVEKQNRENDRG